MGKAIQAFSSGPSTIDHAGEEAAANKQAHPQQIFTNKQISQHHDISKTASVDSQLSAKALNNVDASYLPPAMLRNADTSQQPTPYTEKLSSKRQQNQTGLDQQEFIQL